MYNYYMFSIVFTFVWAIHFHINTYMVGVERFELITVGILSPFPLPLGYTPYNII